MISSFVSKNIILIRIPTLYKCSKRISQIYKLPDYTLQFSDIIRCRQCKTELLRNNDIINKLENMTLEEFKDKFNDIKLYEVHRMAFEFWNELSEFMHCEGCIPVIDDNAVVESYSMAQKNKIFYDAVSLLVHEDDFYEDSLQIMYNYDDNLDSKLAQVNCKHCKAYLGMTDIIIEVKKQETAAKRFSRPHTSTSLQSDDVHSSISNQGYSINTMEMGDSYERKSDKIDNHSSTQITLETINKFKTKIKPSQLDIVTESDVNEVYSQFTEHGYGEFIDNTLNNVKQTIVERRSRLHCAAVVNMNKVHDNQDDYDDTGSEITPIENLVYNIKVVNGIQLYKHKIYVDKIDKEKGNQLEIYNLNNYLVFEILSREELKNGVELMIRLFEELNSKECIIIRLENWNIMIDYDDYYEYDPNTQLRVGTKQYKAGLLKDALKISFISTDNWDKLKDYDIDWNYQIKNSLIMSQSDFLDLKILLIKNSSLIPSLSRTKNGWTYSFLLFNF